MTRTQKLWLGDARAPGRASLGASAVIAALLSALLMAYALFAFHPVVVRFANQAWSAWGGQPMWALSTVAVGTVVAAASLALMLLAAVVRGVQRAPYAWAAPVLIGAGVLQAAQLDTRLPISGLPVSVFSISSGLLMLVGGGLLQLRGWAFRLSGVLLLTLPVMTIVTGYALAPEGLVATWQALGGSNRMFAIVLAATFLGTGLLSLTTRPLLHAGHAARQLERWKERAERGEIRLAQAQRRAEAAEQRLAQANGPWLDRSMTGGGWYARASAAVMASALIAAYFFAYKPLVERSRAQRAELIAAARAQQLAIESARQQFEAQRAPPTPERAQPAGEGRPAAPRPQNGSGGP